MPLGDTTAAPEHAFQRHPHRAVLGLSWPIFLSLIAEPITGLVDTAFVKELGASESAALGAGTLLLSSIFWVFNFLAIGTQTEVARFDGAGQPAAAQRVAAVGIRLAFWAGALMAVAAWLGAATWGAHLMGASGATAAAAADYVLVRSLGAPAVLLTLVAFGSLRGVQDVRGPLVIAVGVNVANAALDAVLILGAGPIPALGVAGAAWATVVAQWAGALLGLWMLRRRLGVSRAPFAWSIARSLLVVGSDLFFRTAMLTAFLFYGTRVATQHSDAVGAAHQAIRSMWMLAAYAIDAFAVTAQTLVGFFRGAERLDIARRVASVTLLHSVVAGAALAGAMLLGQDAVAAALVPSATESPAAVRAFAAGWWIAALAQPLNAAAFATDGVHWGTADYRFLRNAMLIASAGGVALLALAPTDGPAEACAAWIWSACAAWVSLRAALGAVRIWPGFGPWRDLRGAARQ